VASGKGQEAFLPYLHQSEAKDLDPLENPNLSRQFKVLIYSIYYNSPNINEKD